MTVIGIDDTDSREEGMCTTYVASRIAADIEHTGGRVDRTLLVRLNPAVEHKTRGNAALAIHCNLPAEEAFAIAESRLDLAATEDDRTNPGLVIADTAPDTVPKSIADFADRAVIDYWDPADARNRSDSAGFRTATRGNGRGLVGALAAVGAWRAFDEWTYECISYRNSDRWGTDRQVDRSSVFAAAEEAYPTVWDTVDREEYVAVCVPRTPCPILHGIRGDNPDAVREVAQAIDGEPVVDRQLFVTNQGTDAHLRSATLADVENGYAYRVDATVVKPPETREGGHVFLTLGDEEATVDAAAFEPTKRFRDHVRSLRSGDRLTVCGEVQSGTLKLEKFAVRDLVRTETVTPTCPECGLRMESAGSDAGYRCRDCRTSADSRIEQSIERGLEEGWYEVPPCARRHIAKPLVRGGFDAQTHPER